MKKYIGLAIIGIGLVGALYGVSRPRSSIQPKIGRTLGATVFPMADITRAIAGDQYTIIQIIPTGASPHTFELTPKQIKNLTEARAVFAIGVIDDWVDDVALSLNIPKYTTYQGISLKEVLPETGSQTENFDPHYWLSVPNAKIMARNVADKLSQLDPSGEAGFRQRLTAYEIELDNLDQSMRQDFNQLANRKLITFHDSWNYFAAEYGFTIAAVFESSPGKEPTPQYAKRIYDTAKAESIPAIFSEPTLPTNALEPFVKDLGIKMAILDPEGGVVGVDTYLAMMRYNADTIVSALR